MPYVLGIDIGTSFTAAAIARLGPDGLPAPQTLTLGLRGDVVPSVIFLAEDGQVLVGEAAERRGTGHPDRVVREFKRRVGDAVPIIVGDLCVAPQDIFATMARWVVDRAQEREGEPPETVILSHPASWGDYKTELVRLALAGVGLADVVLLSEPEAAALHYATQERVNVGSTIAVYDLGGGTFDVAILKKSSSETFTPLGRPEGIERLGGADFDEAVFNHVKASVGDAFTDLDPTDPGVLVALSRVRRECIEAKEALSFDSEASIPVLLPGAQAHVRLVRSEFESMIEGSVRETIKGLNHAVKTAGVETDDLTTILLIGGSSRIPLVSALISDELDRPIAIDSDPKASISLGAAYSASAALIEVAKANTIREREAENGAAEDDLESGSNRPNVGVAVAPFAPRSPAPAKAGHTRLGVGVTAAAALVAALVVVTATAAQLSPDFGPVASGTAAENGAIDIGMPLADLQTRQNNSSNPTIGDGSVGPKTPDAATPLPLRPTVPEAPAQRPFGPKVPDVAAPRSIGPKVPAPTTPPTSDPDPSTPPTSKPDPSIPPTSKPDPSIPPTSKPDPSIPPTSDPDPSIPPTSKPDPSIPPTSKPDPSIPPTSKPDPSIPPTSKPDPSIPPTSDPDPSPSPTSDPDPSPSPTSDPDPSPSPTSDPEPTASPTSTPEPTASPTLSPQVPEPTLAPVESPAPAIDLGLSA